MPVGSMKDRQGRRLAATAVAALAVTGVAAAGCSRSGGGGTLPTLRPTTTMGHGDHGGTGGDTGGGHGGHGGGSDQPPTAEQQAKALKLVADTKAAVQRQGLNTVAGIQRAGYISIGDEMTGTTHYVKPALHYDGKELDPNAIESFAVRQGRPVAAMYILENGKTMQDVPDIAGNWTIWHLHTLPFRSNDPKSNGYYQLGGRYTRTTAPMLHVWLEDNPCGPFAGTDTRNMTGSCTQHSGH